MQDGSAISRPDIPPASSGGEQHKKSKEESGLKRYTSALFGGHQDGQKAQKLLS